MTQAAILINCRRQIDAEIAKRQQIQYHGVPQPPALTSDRAFHTMPHKTVTEGKKYMHKNYYLAPDQQIWEQPHPQPIWHQTLPQPVVNNNMRMVNP